MRLEQEGRNLGLVEAGLPCDRRERWSFRHRHGLIGADGVAGLTPAPGELLAVTGIACHGDGCKDIRCNRGDEARYDFHSWSPYLALTARCSAASCSINRSRCGSSAGIREVVAASWPKMSASSP